MVCDMFASCLLDERQGDSSQCDSCRSESCYPIISCSENGRRYKLRNDCGYNVKNYLIDGGVYVNENSMNKCDRLFLVHDPDKCTAILIELKGKNVYHALEQLYDTAYRYRKELTEFRVRFRIVCKSVPNMANDSKTIKLKKDMLQMFGSIPMVREYEYEERYSKME